MTTTAGTAGGLRYGRALELKTADEGWSVEGYVSTYDVDLGNDRVLPGAFRRTLGDGHKIRFLYAHQPHQVLGVPLSLKEDGRAGLYGKFRISKTGLGEEVRTLLLDGALDSFSIGFIPKDYEHDPKSGVRSLKQVELLECSVVAMPMNPGAVVTAAKAATKSLTVQYLEGYVARLRAKHRFAGMTPAQVEREAEAMQLRLRLGLFGAGR